METDSAHAAEQEDGEGEGEVEGEVEGEESSDDKAAAGPEDVMDIDSDPSATEPEQ